MHAESASVDITSENIQNELRKIEELLEPCDPADIMNFDETGLYYQQPLRITICSELPDGLKIFFVYTEIIDNFKAPLRAQQYDRALCLYVSKKLDNPNVYKMDQAQAMVFLANERLKVKPETINGMLPGLPRNFDNKVTDVSQLNLEADESEMIVCYTTSTTNNEETAEGNIDETEENDNTEQDEQRVDIVEFPLDDLDRKLHCRIRMRLADSCAELNVKRANRSSILFYKKIPSNQTPLNRAATVFRRIFSLNNNLIRIKCGESVSDSMKKGREELYPRDSNVVSFKVDLRFIYDDDEFEIDLATVECSKPKPNDEKNERDSGKLCQESKDSLDTIWDLLKYIQWGVKYWSLQISGSVDIDSTTHYTQNGFYVVIPRFQFHFPTSFASMADFIDDINNLLMIRNDIEKTAHYLQHTLKSNWNSVSSISQKFEYAINMESPPHLPSTHINTYYTPPRNDATRSKAPLFVEMSDSLVDMTDIEGFDSDTSNLDPEEGEEEEEERGEFKKQADGSWLHIAAGVHMSCNPFE
ncbi:hypothetical protein G6F43_002033 [Rhizopus delemar]|nr:hypothetical protein G6F43_002033 [Rhizopus delemar]